MRAVLDGDGLPIFQSGVETMADIVARQTLGSVMAQRAREHPGRPFVQVVGEKSVSYGEVYREAEHIGAGFLEQNVAPGDSVVVMLPNGFEVICSWIALGLVGAVETCINTAYRGATLAHALNTCRARLMVIHVEWIPRLRQITDELNYLEKVFVVGGNFPDQLAQIKVRAFDSLFATEQQVDEISDRWPEVKNRDAASIIYTSGTTGPAKAVVMPHAQASLEAYMTVQHLRLTSDDIFYCTYPMFHMAGKFMIMYGILLVGGTVILDEAFDASNWLKNLRKYGATIGGGHGPMLEMIHAQPPTEADQDHHVTRMLACPFPRKIARDFEQRFGVKGREVWGMTEVGVPVWSSYDEPLREGSCGAVDHDWYELKIVDPESDEELPAGTAGEILIREKKPWTVMSKYMGMPEKTLEDWRNSWFHSGDFGMLDEDGYLYFVDRVKDRIRRRAENISSYDIESAVSGFPDIQELAAVGVPSGFEGDDDVKIVVVPAAEGTVEPEKLIRYLVGMLPHHMVPRYVEIVGSLPRTPTNKVKKNELRDWGISDSVWDRKAAGISLKGLSEEESA